MILTKAISAYIAHDYLIDYKPKKEYTTKYKNTPNSLQIFPDTIHSFKGPALVDMIPMTGITAFPLYSFWDLKK